MHAHAHMCVCVHVYTRVLQYDWTSRDGLLNDFLGVTLLIF
jgi:hypothetical protein